MKKVLDKLFYLLYNVLNIIKKGDHIMTDALRIEKLEKNISNLAGDKSKDFARSLVNQFRNKGDLSDKQWYWVDQLSAPEKLPETTKHVTTELGDLDRVYRMFANAKSNLKWPKILLQDEFNRVEFKMPGNKSKYYGRIVMTDGGRYGENEWYGSIDEHGTWMKPRKPLNPELEKLVERFAKDPEATAAEHGGLTGNCCFCRRHLSDEKSTDVGYGPTCAKNFGLKWGKKENKRALDI